MDPASDLQGIGTSRWATDPRVLFDVAVAVLFGLFSAIEVAGVSDNVGSGARQADALAYGLVAVAALALVWRRRASIAVLAVVTVVVAVFWIGDYGAMLSLIGLPAMYSVAAHCRDRRAAWVAMGASFVVLVTVASLTVLDRPDGYDLLTGLSMMAFLVAAMVGGVAMRNRERIFVDSQRRAVEAEADRQAEAERAVASERARIARELHDVVAHGMSVIAVQAAAGRQVLRTDPDRADQVLAGIEAVGRESLTELRRMLGVLREDADAPASLSPQPGLADVATSVAEATATGVPTRLVVEGEVRELSAGLELAAYRIVQEALTNVRKHAGRSAGATVWVRYAPDSLEVEVVDDGRGAMASLLGVGAGHGLIGMRERVEIYGGKLSAGPQRGGGFGVRATFPVGSTAPVGGRLLRAAEADR